MNEFERIRAINTNYDMGLGFDSMKKGIAIAHERFGGDLFLGLLWIDAASLAISVGKNLPVDQRQEARNRWNDDHARSHKDRLIARKKGER